MDEQDTWIVPSLVELVVIHRQLTIQLLLHSRDEVGAVAEGDSGEELEVAILGDSNLEIGCAAKCSQLENVCIRCAEKESQE